MVALTVNSVNLRPLIYDNFRFYFSLKLEQREEDECVP